MLQPARRKIPRQKSKKAVTPVLRPEGSSVAFGDFGLKCTDRGRLTARQIEAGTPVCNFPSR